MRHGVPYGPRGLDLVSLTTNVRMMAMLDGAKCVFSAFWGSIDAA